MVDGGRIEVAPVVAALAARLAAHGHDVLLVGGAVRDALLGRETFDFDLVSDASPPQVREALDGAPGVRSIYSLGERFGTVGVALDGGGIAEVTQFRAGPAGATASERFVADAALRDFTVDAIAATLPEGVVLDPASGRADLATRIVRAVGDPVARFRDDPVRVLRAARLASELGFEVSLATIAGMHECADRVSGVAVERVRAELTKLLVSPEPERGLAVLRDTGALRVVLPEVAALDGVTQPTFHDLDALEHTFATVAAAPNTPVLRWAALLHDTGKAPARTVGPDGRIRFHGHAALGAEIARAVCERLRFSNSDSRAIAHLVAEHMRFGDLVRDNPRAVDRAIRRLELRDNAGRALVTAEDALDLAMADFAATAHRDEMDSVRSELESALASSRTRGSANPPRSPLSGSELMTFLDVGEGPLVGEAQAAIVAAIDSGSLDPNDRAGALAVARSAIGSRRD